VRLLDPPFWIEELVDLFRAPRKSLFSPKLAPPESGFRSPSPYLLSFSRTFLFLKCVPLSFYRRLRAISERSFQTSLDSSMMELFPEKGRTFTLDAPGRSRIPPPIGLLGVRADSLPLFGSEGSPSPL